jgi:hypothetical protein
MRRWAAVSMIACAIACGGGSDAKRVAAIKERVQVWGQESFPDEPDTAWKFISSRDKKDYSIVTVEPYPRNNVYPSFRFIIHFPRGAEPVFVACFALDDKKWVQLFEDSQAPADWHDKTGL